MFIIHVDSLILFQFTRTNHRQASTEKSWKQIGHRYCNSAWSKTTNSLINFEIIATTTSCSLSWWQNLKLAAITRNKKWFLHSKPDSHHHFVLLNIVKVHFFSSISIFLSCAKYYCIRKSPLHLLCKRIFQVGKKLMHCNTSHTCSHVADV